MDSNKKNTLLRMFGMVDDSIVDGPGIRFALFVQGCMHCCPGCHNPDAQPKDGGYDVSLEEIITRIKSNPLLSGVTFTGGEPFDQPDPLIALAQWIRAFERKDAEGKLRLPLTIWAYSGYTFEALLASKPSRSATKLLELCDVLVDGPFIQAQHDYQLRWRGSANQRIIDVPASLSAGVAVLVC